MSVSKQLIAKYFLDEWTEVAFSSTRLIAKKLGVSEALVVRLSIDLGYSGFKDLQNELRDMIRTKLGRVYRIRSFKTDITEKNIAPRVLAVEQQNISRILELNSVEQVEKAVEILAQARRIFTVGERNAGAMALLTAIHLNEILNNTISLAGMLGNAADYLREADGQDVLLAISLPVYSQHTIDMVQLAQEKQLRIVAITDSLVSPLARMADVTLLTSCDTITFNLSHVGTLVLINMLVASLGIRLHHRAETLIAAIDDYDKKIKP